MLDFIRYLPGRRNLHAFREMRPPNFSLRHALIVKVFRCGLSKKIGKGTNFIRKLYFGYLTCKFEVDSMQPNYSVRICSAYRVAKKIEILVNNKIRRLLLTSVSVTFFKFSL